MSNYKLYGMPASLYTGKVRSYFRKQGIRFVERGANHPDYAKHVIPGVKRFIIPVVEAQSGMLIQDGADIIDHFEAGDEKSYSVIPQSSLLKCVSYLFELFGGEGLLRPAMHYRWDFDEHNLDFLRNDFPAALAPIGCSEQQADEFFASASGRMRKAAKSFGVTKESIPKIEAAYIEFLTLFSAHLKQMPYLLGGKPTIGDFGLVAALYAHLNRDPYPAALTKRVAAGVSRWVERMHAEDGVWVEYTENEELIAEDDIPESLKHLMRYIAEEYLPEIVAHVDYANAWLAERPDLEPGTNGLSKPGVRFIGSTSFEWRGMKLETSVLPYRFYLLQRIQDSFDAATESDRSNIRSLFEETGLKDLLATRTSRRVERVDHLEVWGEIISK